MKDRLITVVISVATTFGLMHAPAERRSELEVDRLIVRKELIVSDTGQPWEDGFEDRQIARGIYARSLGDGPGGLWVRSRLIKGEIDDPFDDRFHAVNRDGRCSGRHNEPLTDALIGQGMMSLGGGGYGGGGLPHPSEVLQLWGGDMRAATIPLPQAPRIVKDDGTGEHRYAIIAIGPQGARTKPSQSAKAQGLAMLRWDSVPGADAYIVLRDGKQLAGPLRLEDAEKTWTDGGDR